MKILFESALLPGGWAQSVCVTTDTDGSIVEVTPDADEPSLPVCRGAMIPGVPNVHSHAHQRVVAGLTERSCNKTDSFWAWRDRMYYLVERIQPPQLKAIAGQLYLELLKAGYTNVAEFHYLHHDPFGRPYNDPAECGTAILEAATEVGIGITILPALYAYSNFGARPALSSQRRFTNGVSGFLELVDRLQQVTRGDPRLSTGIAFHSLRAVSPALLTQVLGLEPDGPVHIHIAEQKQEVDECVSWCGRRPIEWLLDEVEVNERWCLVHATHMTLQELLRVARSNAVVGICPSTEANLGDGLFDGLEYLVNGGRFGIGSDSNVSTDPREELRWFEYGQRLQHQRRNVLTSHHLVLGHSYFEGALSGGAQASGLPLGRVEIGCRGDFVVFDTSAPLLAGRTHDAVIDSWIFSGNSQLVKDVFVAGRHVVENGRHASEARIAAAFLTAVQQLSLQF